MKRKRQAGWGKWSNRKIYDHLIIGTSEPLQEIYRLLNSLRDSESPVLISGETGTGKELIAHTIHRASKRNKNPFVILDCSVLNKNLLESELFGHVTGCIYWCGCRQKGHF